jgi:hypothetical protein
MKASQRRRLTDLERICGTVADQAPSFWLCFADDQYATRARSGQREWQREADEDAEAFHARIVTDLEETRDTPYGQKTEILQKSLSYPLPQ